MLTVFLVIVYYRMNWGLQFYWLNGQNRLVQINFSDLESYDWLWSEKGEWKKDKELKLDEPDESIICLSINKESFRFQIAYDWVQFCGFKFSIYLFKNVATSPNFFSYFLYYPFSFFSVPTLLSSSKMQYFWMKAPSVLPLHEHESKIFLSGNTNTFFSLTMILQHSITTKRHLEQFSETHIKKLSLVRRVYRLARRLHSLTKFLAMG